MEYAILGGGALGLMTAYRLTQAGHSVMVFEQEKIAGGLASGFHVGNDGESWLEKYYHHLFRTDKTAINTIKELGLGDRVAEELERGPDVHRRLIRLGDVAVLGQRVPEVGDCG